MKEVWDALEYWLNSADGTGMDSPKLGSSTEENSPAPSENVDTIGPERKRRNPILMMVLVLGVGLLVSLAYLGGRISSAHASVAAIKPAAFADAGSVAAGDRALTVAARKEETLVGATKVAPAPVVSKEVAKAAPVVVAKEVSKANPAVAVAPVVTKDVAKATPAMAPVVVKEMAKVVAAKEVAKSTPAVAPVAAKEVAKSTRTVEPIATKEAPKVSPVAASTVAQEVAKVTPAAVPVVKKEVDRSLTVAARKDQVSVAPVAVVEESNVQLLHPKPGVAYVQVGAFVSPYAQNWVSVLKQRGFNPVVAEGPNSAVHRVLLGPFGPAEIAEVETKLRASGIDHFERIY